MHICIPKLFSCMTSTSVSEPVAQSLCKYLGTYMYTAPASSLRSVACIPEFQGLQAWGKNKAENFRDQPHPRKSQPQNPPINKAAPAIKGLPYTRAFRAFFTWSAFHLLGLCSIRNSACLVAFQQRICLRNCIGADRRL